MNKFCGKFKSPVSDFIHNAQIFVKFLRYEYLCPFLGHSIDKHLSSFYFSFNLEYRNKDWHRVYCLL